MSTDTGDLVERPKRFTLWCAASHGHAPQEHDAGEFVLYADYAAQAATIAERDRQILELSAALADEAVVKQLNGELQTKLEAAEATIAALKDQVETLQACGDAYVERTDKALEAAEADARKFANQHAQVLEAVRNLGLHSWWDAPHWNLRVKREAADHLFNVVYGFDQQALKDTALAVHADAALSKEAGA